MVRPARALACPAPAMLCSPSLTRLTCLSLSTIHAVIGGLKASLSNDNNSEEAKKEDQARLDKLAEQGHQGFTTE